MRMRWVLGLIPCLLVAAILSGCAPSGVGRDRAPTMDQGSVLDTARSQIGRPYHTAGDSPETGFDCSGFVQWVFSRHGLRLPRRTEDQALSCHTVPWGELRAGDLVFFAPSYRTSALHVGIFDGRGSFIHSPSPGGRVRSESIMAPYWRSTYYKACRVLP
jgi:cell wall-associated NlpC family hydrolase